MRRALLSLVALALVVGCGGDDSGDDDASTTTVEDSGPSANEQLAEDVIVTLADLPDGWGPPAVNFAVIEAALANAAEEIPSCEDLDLSLAGLDEARAVAAFDHEDGTTMSVQVYVFDDADGASEWFTATRTEESATCVDDLIGDVSGVDLETDGYQSESGIGDEAVSLTLTADGVTIEQTKVLVDRGVVTWVTNGPEAVDLRDELDTTVERLGDALTE